MMMMTVREHMKLAGYDLDKAWNANRLRNFAKQDGTMECERIQIRTFRCCPCSCEEMLAVEAVAMVLFTDGYEHPYPMGWPRSLEASVTAYFPIKKEDE